MSAFLSYLCSGLPLNPLPVNKHRDPNLAHAPKRVHHLTTEQQNQALQNALRYFPNELHSLLKEEFQQELNEYGHIYMYR